MNKHILCVEDDIPILGLYEHAFKEEGIYARSIQEAYEFYFQYRPDLIIVDFNLGGATPLDFMDYVKLDNPDVKIVMITAYPVDVALKYLKSPIEKVYNKPVTAEFLRRLPHSYNKESAH